MVEVLDYFESDLENTFRLRIVLPKISGVEAKAYTHLEFQSGAIFLSIFVPGKQSVKYYSQLLHCISGDDGYEFDGNVVLAAARRSQLRIRGSSSPPFIQCLFPGESQWVDHTLMDVTKRLFLYCEEQPTAEEMEEIRQLGRAPGIDKEVQFRSVEYAKQRTILDIPLAFICHDSRDKEDVARPLAIELQKRMCPVWYDEFSMTVGDSLHDKIMEGLKTSPVCVLVLSKNFFGNTGWSKTEYITSFTKELRNRKGALLPVWYGVDAEQVFSYSPPLADIIGLNWEKLGCEEVTRRLIQKINAVTDN